MTTYNAAAVNDATIAFQKPITLQQGRALRDNTLAIAEADATVPLNLLPTVFLGTANTTSGTSVSVTGLNLAPYKTLKVFLNGVAATRAGTGFNLLIGGQNCAFEPASSATFTGVIDVDLFNGVFAPSIYAALFGVSASLTNAATSVALSVNSGAAFTAGAFRVYGCK